MIPWGCEADTLKEIDKLAEEWGVGVHIHVSETREEVEMSLDEYGVPPVQWLHDIGVLNERWQLVHGVWLEEGEMDLIADAGSVLVHCPISNMYLASGGAKVTEWLDREIPVAVATDGPGSNNSQDMLEVLKFTACLQKVETLDAMSMLPEEVLGMSYGGGARAMDLEGAIGRLEPGYLADVVVVGLQRPHIAPAHSPQSALVYNANGNDVDTVVVDGEVLVRDGEMVHIDEQKLIADCRRAAEAMFERGGIESPKNVITER